MGVYIINGRVTRNNIYDRSHRGYFMEYEYTTGFILYWKPNQSFVIHRAHHVWFDEYNSRISIEDKHTLVSLLLIQYLESCIYNSNLLNLIPCEIDLKTTSFNDTTIITYEIELSTSENKFSLNLLDDEYLKYHISLIQSQIRKLFISFQNRLSEIFVS